MTYIIQILENTLSFANTLQNSDTTDNTGWLSYFLFFNTFFLNRYSTAVHGYEMHAKSLKKLISILI